MSFAVQFYDEAASVDLEASFKSEGLVGTMTKQSGLIGKLPFSLTGEMLFSSGVKVAAPVINTPGNLMLVHFDGINGAVSWSDVYGAVLVNNGAVLSTTLPKFGSASVKSATASAGGFSFTGLADFDMSNQNWTLELWVKPFNFSTMFSFLGGFGLSHVPSLGWVVGEYGGVTFKILTSTLTTSSVWTHVAVVRNGIDLLLFEGGVLVDSATLTSVTTVLNYLSAFTEFTFEAGSYLDEFRLRRGEAVYTSNFTPAGPLA